MAVVRNLVQENTGNSLLGQQLELARQRRTGDTEFYQKKPYIFVINGPANKGPIGASGQAIFPLPIGIESYSYDLPFAAEVTVQQERGVIADEAGFVLGELTIDATTGFALRLAKDVSRPVDTEFTSALAKEPADNELISGQMQFWRLAGRCFEGYSRLKQDPKTAEQTTMEFHSLRDRLSLLVVPRNFRLTRSATKERVIYRFQVRLSVVGQARGNAPVIVNDSRTVLDSMRDGIANVRKAVQGLSATLDDLTAATDALRRQLSAAISVMDDIRGIVSSANDLLDGTKRYLDLPKQAITSAALAVEDVAELADTLELNRELRATLRSASDDLHRLAVGATDYYRRDLSDEADDYNTATNRTGPNQSETLDTARQSAKDDADDAQGTQSFDTVFGGAVQPGDLVRAQIADRVNRLRAQYNSFEELVIGRGDTLAALAARHLGDATKALELALLNQLSPPWITVGPRLPGTLQPGDKILIPRSDTAAPNRTITTATTEIGKSQLDEHLGRTWKQVKVGRQYDLAVDTAHGSHDLETVSGVAAVLQTLGVRLRTEQGDNLTFPDLGLPRMVGQLELGRDEFAVRQQMVADLRVDSVLQTKISRDKDVVTQEVTVLLRGSDTPRTVSRVQS